MISRPGPRTPGRLSMVAPTITKECCVGPTITDDGRTGRRKSERLPVQRGRRHGRTAAGAGAQRGVPGHRRGAGARREGHREVDDRARAWRRCCPTSTVVAGCRFSCDPAAPDPSCPDGPHEPGAGSVTRPARLVELPVGASEDRLVGAAGHRAGADRGRQGVRARAAGRRAPGRAVRGRGQPAPRPPGGPAARRGRAGHLLRRAGRGLGPARGPVPAGRHHEPGGGRAAPAAAGPVRADRRGRAPRATRRCAARWSGAGSPTTPIRPPSPGRWQAAEAGAGGADRGGQALLPRRGAAATPRCGRSPRCARRSTWTGCARTWSRRGPRSRTPRGRAGMRSPPRTCGPPRGWRCRTGGAGSRSTRRSWTRRNSTGRLAGAGEDPDDDPGPGDDGPGGGESGPGGESEASSRAARRARMSAATTRGRPAGPWPWRRARSGRRRGASGQPRPGAAPGRPPAAAGAGVSGQAARSPGGRVRLGRPQVPGPHGLRARHRCAACRGPDRPGARARHVRRGRAAPGGPGPGRGRQAAAAPR